MLLVLIQISFTSAESHPLDNFLCVVLLVRLETSLDFHFVLTRSLLKGVPVYSATILLTATEY